jgi:hypothetical protein
MIRAAFSIEHASFVCVTDLDLDGARSVTNDIENVIADLVTMERLFPGDRLIYRDSEGTWDEVVLDDACRFVDFRRLATRRRSLAIAYVLELMETRA